ncbi:unnamed protein product [Closterium sp. NIES-54]
MATRAIRGHVGKSESPNKALEQFSRGSPTCGGGGRWRVVTGVVCAGEGVGRWRHATTTFQHDSAVVAASVVAGAILLHLRECLSNSRLLQHAPSFLKMCHVVPLGDSAQIRIVLTLLTWQFLRHKVSCRFASWAVGELDFALVDFILDIEVTKGDAFCAVEEAGFVRDFDHALVVAH